MKTIKPIKAWAIIDIQKKTPRWTYNGEAPALAISDKKPFIHWRWKPFKQVIPILITPLKPKK